MILRLPLYCRPIRDLTPEKPNSNIHDANFKPNPTFISKIPGLPPQGTVQGKSKVSVKQKEKNAFDVLKQAQLKNIMNEFLTIPSVHLS